MTRSFNRTLKLARELGVIVTAHCENETADRRTREGVARGRETGPEGHHSSRPPPSRRKACIIS